MGLFDSIKQLFIPAAEEVSATKQKLASFMQQALKKNDLAGYEIVYGKMIEKKDTLTTRKTQYFNYAIAFNNHTGDLVILPIDAKLASFGWPVFVHGETLKKAKLGTMSTIYTFDFKDDTTIMFEVPAQNYKIGKMLGAVELPILQQQEAKAFKEFFRVYFQSPK